MKRFAILIAPLLLVACEPSVQSASSGCPDGGLAANTVMDEKAYAGALVLYNVPAQAYKTLDQRGQLPATTKAKVRPILIKMYDGLIVLKSAYDAGNTSNFLCQLGSLERGSASAKSLLGVQ